MYFCECKETADSNLKGSKLDYTPRGNLGFCTWDTNFQEPHQIHPFCLYWKGRNCMKMNVDCIPPQNSSYHRFEQHMPILAVLCHSEIPGCPGKRIRMETTAGFSFGIECNNTFNYVDMEMSFATHLWTENAPQPLVLLTKCSKLLLWQRFSMQNPLWALI